MHCKAHQPGQTNVIVGNQLADKATQGVAEKNSSISTTKTN